MLTHGQISPPFQLPAAAFRASLSAGSPLQALRLLGQLRDQRLEASCALANAAVDACAKRGWWEMACALLGEIQAEALEVEA